MSRSALADSIFGIFCAGVGALVVLAYQRRDALLDVLIEKINKEFDEQFDAEKKEVVYHKGSCHCERTRFRARAPKLLKAIEITSKIPFPRVSILCEDFEFLTDESTLSLYAVKQGEAIGVHSFCSYCGVHILYSPSTNPVHIQVNLDCIDRNAVDRIRIRHASVAESHACPSSFDAAAPFNRRGSGSFQLQALSSMSMASNLVPFQTSPHRPTSYSSYSGGEAVDASDVRLSMSGVEFITADRYDENVYQFGHSAYIAEGMAGSNDYHNVPTENLSSVVGSPSNQKSFASPDDSRNSYSFSDSKMRYPSSSAVQPDSPTHWQLVEHLRRHLKS